MGSDDHKLTFEGSFSPFNRLHEIPELSPYATHYDQLSLRLGYLRELQEGTLPDWLGNSGPEFLAGFSYAGGSDQNRGSHRYEGELLAGWRQAFFKYVFIDARLGLGVSDNYLNFGKGVPLQQQTSLNGTVEIRLGGRICFNSSSCLSVFTGYSFERTLATDQGLPPYQNQLFFLFGLGFEGLVSGEAGEGMADLRKEKDDLTGAKSRLEKEKEDAQKEIDALKLVNDGQKKEISQLEKRSPPSPVMPSLEEINFSDSIAFPEDSSSRKLQMLYEPGQGWKERDLQLDSVAQYLDEHPEIKRVRIDGYANKTGSEKGNRLISLRRALWVKEYLVKTGKIDAARLLVDGRFLDAGGKPVLNGDGSPMLDYKKSFNPIVKDAEGPSVHGDGREPSGAAKKLPYQKSAEDRRNRCVLFLEVKK